MYYSECFSDFRSKAATICGRAAHDRISAAETAGQSSATIGSAVGYVVGFPRLKSHLYFEVFPVRCARRSASAGGAPFRSSPKINLQKICYTGAYPAVRGSQRAAGLFLNCSVHGSVLTAKRRLWPATDALVRGPHTGAAPTRRCDYGNLCPRR